MNRCDRCGVPYHPDLVRCPLCRTLARSEAVKRKRLFFITQTVAISGVALVVLMRVLTGPDIAVGMTSSDCGQIASLRTETATALQGLVEERPDAKVRLAELGSEWLELADNYVPGKFSWSSSGPEHGWLEKLGTVTSAIAAETDVQIEDSATSPEDYAQQLLRLEYRFCN